jgi:hypothetical protein
VQKVSILVLDIAFFIAGRRVAEGYIEIIVILESEKEQYVL